MFVLIIYFVRILLWRYLESQGLPRKFKEGLYKGALEMVEIARQIWKLEQC